MPIELVNVGLAANDGTGDPYRDGMQKVNRSLTYLDTGKASNTAVAEAIATINQALATKLNVNGNGSALTNLNAAAITTGRLNANVLPVSFNAPTATSATSADTAAKWTTGRQINGVVVDGTQNVTIPVVSTSMVTNSDADTYLTPGMYHASSNALAQSITNLPQATAGALLVQLSNSPGVIQTYTTYVANSNRRTYQRSRQSTGLWSTWTNIVTGIDPQLSVTGSSGLVTVGAALTTNMITGTGTTETGVEGVRFDNIYDGASRGYPLDYAVRVQMKGSGSSAFELFAGWQDNTGTRLFARSRGDVPTQTWKAARELAFLDSSITGTAAGLTTPRAITIGNTAKNFDGTAAIAYTLAEIGALPTDGTMGQVAFRNVLINGSMRWSQRGSSLNNPANNTYLLDRWKLQYDGTGGARVMSQQAFAAGAEAEGCQFFLRLQQTSASSGGTAVQILQSIENARTLAGKKVTLSFSARSAAALTMPSIFLNQAFGVGGSATVVVPVATNRAITTAWTRYKFTFTMPSISGKTIGTDSTIDVVLRTPSAGAYTFEVTAIQLEEGDTATPFEKTPLATELAQCQRYFEIAPFIANADGSFFTNVFYAVTKRVVPTLSLAWGNVSPATLNSRGFGYFSLDGRVTGAAEVGVWANADF